VPIASPDRPRLVARIESNFLINPEHPDFRKIVVGLRQPVWWDARLLAAPP
jgi:hypothetical protein